VSPRFQHIMIGLVRFMFIAGSLDLAIHGGQLGVLVAAAVLTMMSPAPKVIVQNADTSKLAEQVTIEIMRSVRAQR
jgi:hypothetical protein